MVLKIYEDDFSREFGNQEEFIAFLREREKNARWERHVSKDIEFTAMDEEKYMFSIEESVYRDTYKNTGLLLKVSGGGSYPVRSSAIMTILSRARISGKALSDVPKPALASIINHCMKVAPGVALIRHSEEKVSAVHGGDSSDYAPLAMPNLFRMTAEYLGAEFPGATFAGGFYSHTIVSALWELTGSDSLLQAYKDALKNHGIMPKTMKPALRLSSSDVGVNGANLFPMLITDGERTVTLGSALRLAHKAGKRDERPILERFEEKLKMVFAQYTAAIKGLTGLLEIEINHPVNCIMEVMKSIGFRQNKKLAFEVIDLFKAQYGEEPCTAHDIYFGICEAVFILQCGGADSLKLIEAEEKTARALSVRWSDYDIPGELNW